MTLWVVVSTVWGGGFFNRKVGFVTQAAHCFTSLLPDIDEASPSEDERVALEGLCALGVPRELFLFYFNSILVIHLIFLYPATPVGGQQEEGDGPEGADNTINVLENHRTTNKARRAPTLEQLMNKNFQQDLNFDADHEPENKDTESDDEAEGGYSMRRAARNSKGILDAKPTTLRFYSMLRGWPNVLIRAKKRFAVYISTINAFPECSEHLDDAAKILARAISDFEAQGGEVDDGKSSLKLTNKLNHSLSISLPRIPRYGYRCKRGFTLTQCHYLISNNRYTRRAQHSAVH